MTLTKILFFIFLILKLTGFIAWSWWIVFLPIFIELTLKIAFEIWKEKDPIGYARFWWR